MADRDIFCAASFRLTDSVSETKLSHLPESDRITDAVVRGAVISKTLITPVASFLNAPAAKASRVITAGTFLPDTVQKVQIVRKTKPTKIPSPTCSFTVDLHFIQTRRPPKRISAADVQLCIREVKIVELVAVVSRCGIIEAYFSQFLPPNQNNSPRSTNIFVLSATTTRLV